MKNITIFYLKIIIFTAVKNCSILHGHVIVMCLNDKALQYVNRPMQYTEILTSVEITIFKRKKNRVMKKPTFWIPTRSNINQAVQL